MRKRTIPALAIGLVAAATLSACMGQGQSESTVADDCQPAHDLTTIKKNTLLVAATVYPPFADPVENSLGGIEGEVLERFAASECLEVEVVKGSGAALIAMVESGRADVTLGSFFRTAERAEVVRQSEPLYSVPMGLASDDGVSDIDDLDGQRVGFVTGVLWEADLEKLSGPQTVPYDSVTTMWADLASGRIDVATAGAVQLAWSQQQTPIDGVTVEIPAADERVAATANPGQTNLPVSKDNETLGEAIDEFIKDLRADGTIEQIVEDAGLPPEVAEPGDPGLL